MGFTIETSKSTVLFLSACLYSAFYNKDLLSTLAVLSAKHTEVFAYIVLGILRDLRETKKKI